MKTVSTFKYALPISRKSRNIIQLRKISAPKKLHSQAQANFGQALSYKFRATFKGIKSEDDIQMIKDVIQQEKGVQQLEIFQHYADIVLDKDCQIINLLESVRQLNKGIAFKPYVEHDWLWQGKYRVKYAVSGNHVTGSHPPLLMVHGFGASTGHFRKLIALLAPEYRIYSIDLLGFGKSEKPADVTYDPNLWQQQVGDFMKEVVQEPCILVGNSLGSLISLYATHLNQEYVAGIVLLNCSGAMNQKGLYGDSLALNLMFPIFVIMELVLSQRWVVKFLFDNFKSYNNVKQTLSPTQKAFLKAPSVYQNVEAVNAELIDLLIEPSEDEGAVQVFQSVFIGDPGPRPEKLYDQINDIPTLVLWGEKDPWNPIDGKVARYFQKQKERDCQFIGLPNQGHCPMDDRCEETTLHILKWLNEKFQKQ